MRIQAVSMALALSALLGSLTGIPMPKPEPFTVTVQFVGDVELASYMNTTSPGNFNDYANSNPPEYFLSRVKPVFEEDDLTVVNLENVFTDRNLARTPKYGRTNYWYCSRTSNTQILTTSSVEAVSLSNNHTGDYGAAGKQDTIDAVRNAGLLYGTDEETFYWEKNGFTLAVICSGLWSPGDADRIIPRIQEAAQVSDFQIVFYHGGAERTHVMENWRIQASRRLVDSGADLIVGNGPHYIQPREVYSGADILYSLGNFCFGDWVHPENRTVIYRMTLTVDPQTGELLDRTSEFIPCYVHTGASRNNFQPAPIEDPVEKQAVLDFMDGKRGSPL